MNRVDNLCLICIPTRVTSLIILKVQGSLTLLFCSKSDDFFVCVDMVGNGAGPGGDTVIDMPADQQEKKSLV